MFFLILVLLIAIPPILLGLAVGIASLGVGLPVGFVRELWLGRPHGRHGYSH